MGSSGCIFESGVLGQGSGECPVKIDPLVEKTAAEGLCSKMEECVGIEKKDGLFYIVYVCPDSLMRGPQGHETNTVANL